jgi:methionyl-tRNA synthetase
MSACENGDERFWPADVHVVGKDIIRFHAIFWPAMLMSAGFTLPKQVLTTGFFTVDGQKISKSL